MSLKMNSHNVKILDNILIDLKPFKKLNILYNNSIFSELEPTTIDIPTKPTKPTPPFIEFTFIDKLFKYINLKIFKTPYDIASSQYQIDMNAWHTEYNQYETNMTKYHIDLKRHHDWVFRKNTFYRKQTDFNNVVTNNIEFDNLYSKHDVNAINKHISNVLLNSIYPFSFNQEIAVFYSPENKIVCVDYQLPNISDIPTVKEVKTSKSGMSTTIHVSDTQQTKNFDDAIYKIILRSIYEIFITDYANALDAVSFNGWVRSINKATGIEQTNCIATVKCNKNEFMNLNLSNVDPKQCFKGLKGISCNKLHTLTSVRPIMQLNNQDKRFVESYDVAQQLDSSTNLASMDWEDFEHLIRELFQQEFQINGGEVKITQASRDGGVDAVAFDPDPIRGGKIVIQAKRYTNTVDVSAVRELFGILPDEGAMKGILVTTSDYGNDSYEFVKNKPITLINGASLLMLLEKHGHKARINIKEAKQKLI